MKLPENPWVLVRWSVAAAIYAFSLAIAMDQISIRNNAVKLAEAKVTSLTDELRETTAEKNKYLADRNKWKSDATSLAESSKAYMDAVQTREASERNVTVSSTPEAAPAHAAARAPELPRIPTWVPPAPSVVTKSIRDHAAAEHPDDYSMANYEIERQTKAYEKLLRYYQTADPVIKTMISEAAIEHGADYSQLVYSIDRKIEAQRKFNQR